MSSSEQSLVNSINEASIQLNRYLSIVIYLFGTIGNILNVIVLSQRKLRSNSCAFLFLFSSVASLIAIVSGLTDRVLGGWTVDLIHTIDWLCRFRGIIVFTSRTVALWLIAFATVDRWLLSCVDVRRRQISSSKNAQRGVIVIVILSVVLYCPILYCFEANVLDMPSECYPKTPVCQIWTDLTYACGSILAPCLIMTFFSLRIMLNVRRTRTRIGAFQVSQNIHVRIRSKRMKKKDRQFLIMLFVQIITLILLTFPQAAQKLYTTAEFYLQITRKSALLNAVENFFFDFAVLLTYLASSLPFYIYTLAGGSLFRDTSEQLLRIYLRKILH